MAIYQVIDVKISRIRFESLSAIAISATRVDNRLYYTGFLSMVIVV